MMTNVSPGRLYGASLGPGDPGLITRRSWALLQRPDVYWTYPIRRKGANSYALQIALNAGLTLPADHSPLIFPMTHDTEILAAYWLRAAETVLIRLRAGQDVLFLVEGDASTYSTFGHLARTVRALDAGIAIETIPGVPSFTAAAARLAMPLADTDETVAIIPASYGIAMIERLLNDFDTLVLLKVKPLLDDILDLLERRGLLTHAAFIEKAGSPEERIERDLLKLRGQKVNYLSLLLVRNPNRQRGEMLRGCRKKSSLSTTETP
ncbi:Cobalt-precorrin-2 C(20)-methyltransferase (EC 2.1.1.151) [Methylomonas albis]|uniref:Precorrin-2 C(20)-methyltransferase n=1 Tax=Methylomonas albis TaxID=1854563 RepID=A0ABR9CZX5_9GAMM|nr:precorrin-2 C(20)-methyltransferase [Methylomonas albis]MBD9356106.1 precorrin-2 C(20)-methyltransferase [Methylomonas albis]CAD6879160.1 Cobalt-precorrin-2 C(20)-methyltransferase (EC 2.1.1.151) [Methylomonas albis]